MHIKDLLNSTRPAISFEFFPPKTPEGQSALFSNLQGLEQLNPSYVSITYGAGGSTRDVTHNLVLKIHNETNLTVIPHLTCLGHTKEEILFIVEEYVKNGIENIMALRGDPPKGKVLTSENNSFSHAYELVQLIKKHFPHLGIGVAAHPEGHPQTPNRQKEIDYLKQKVDSGADYICTQLFFDNRDLYDFIERCEISGINIPIVAGLMPISSINNMNRIYDLALGSKIPGRLLKSINRTNKDDQSIRKIGIHWISEQFRDLLDNNIRGIHIYTLNKIIPVEICDALGIKSFNDLK